MQIAGIEFPDDLYYDKQHNWKPGWRATPLSRA